EAAYAAALEGARTLLAAAAAAPGLEVGRFATLRPPAEAQLSYLAAVERAIGRIRRGEFYQVNLTIRLSAEAHADPVDLFGRAASRLRPAYGALVPGPTPVVSLSPELFLRVRDGRVTTAPIKGTAPSTDAEAQRRLRASIKDAAENVMIVDLLRNDLSRVSRPGTVVVEDLLRIEPHVGVSHLVSRVSGQLVAGAQLRDVLTAAFPPGSVTGAPKSSALRGIAELEEHGRGAYTGSVGFATPAAGAEFSVLIRSFEVHPGALELGVGGGITVDSVPLREWRECLDKAAPLVRAAGSALDPALGAPEPAPGGREAAGVFESLLARRGQVLRLADHLARLDRSCRELYGHGVTDDLAARLQARAAAHPEVDRLALRVDVTPGPPLSVGVSVRPLGPPLPRSALRHADRAPSSWRHKWRDRSDLDAAERAEAAGRADLPVLPYFTAAGLVAETSRGNLFCRDADGQWRTPPLDAYVLPGVTRRAVLDLLGDAGQPVTIAPVDPTTWRSATGVFWTSSLSGAVAVDAVDDHLLPSVLDLTERLDHALGVIS
ncbi:MAG: chorismate-binding protein, partial [Actinomycetes bacterium]